MPDTFRLLSGETLSFAGATKDDQQKLRESVKPYKLSGNPKIVDSIELGMLAFRRWREALEKGYVAEDVKEIPDFVRNSSEAEVVHLVLVKPLWSFPIEIIGLCHFRRTWCNNIFIDFLTTHPGIIRARPLRGVGTALFYYVVCVATELGANAIWGEATQNSAGFYQTVFKRPFIQDLFYLSAAECVEVKATIERMFNIPSSGPGTHPTKGLTA